MNLSCSPKFCIPWSTPFQYLISHLEEIYCYIHNMPEVFFINNFVFVFGISDLFPGSCWTDLMHWSARAAKLGDSATFNTKSFLQKKLATEEHSVSDSTSFISPVNVLFSWIDHWIQNRVLCLQATEQLFFASISLLRAFWALNISNSTLIIILFTFAMFCTRTALPRTEVKAQDELHPVKVVSQ